ncbi:UNVERIFIED_CONTAM: putative late blight resistance proteinR1A-10 [Sesamum radiatum]|uniref:Late blight resistance proteinR1A-10 n=1 Tax=Sesamum radiatum TaxID=300843 RepID=A0AAW2PIK0_SESRA
MQLCVPCRMSLTISSILLVCVIMSLQENVQALLDFLEAHSQRISEEIEDLGRQIADAAAEAEEVVDRHVVDQLRDRSQEETHCVAALSCFCQDTDNVIGKIDSLAKELMMMVKEKSGDIQEEQRIVSVPVRSAEVHLSSGKKSIMVGFEEHLERIVDKLTRGELDLQILPIVGMGVSLGSQEPYSIDFLNEEKSWDLFCQETFAQEGCPYPELEKIGKNIAKSCDGLPLTIVVIGGLLANSNMTREYWESISENVNAFRNSKDYERCLQISSLSYNSLPIHLKPCFLYMRVFREDSKLRVSKLTKLWIAEGFLKPIRGKSLEEVAEKYLRELIDRNLFLSLTFGYDGSTKTCGMHDLLRDLCLREYEKQHFIYAPKVQFVHVDSVNRYKCFLCGLGTALQKIDLNEVHDASQLTSIASVLVCDTCKNMYPSLNKTRLVRVRLLHKYSDKSFEGEILHPTSLRYLEVKYFFYFEFLSPSTIALLWNQESFSFLSSIVSKNTVVLPSEIWGMPQLRHFLGYSLVILPDEAVSQDPIIMENLHMVSNIRNSRCTKEILERMPNLKQLGISFHGGNGETKWGFYYLHNFVRLQNLESLSIKANDFLLKKLTLPASLKELCLDGYFPSTNMKTIGWVLPNLETLKLSNYNPYKGGEWNQFDGEFPRLKVLEISRSRLKWWRTENIHFPNLENLILSYMLELDHIPAVIGDIPTLHSIHLNHCNDSLIESAMQIVEEQHDNGNESLQLYINEVKYQVGSC